jgi:hypothetical protein
LFISNSSYNALLTAYQKLASQLTDTQNSLQTEREATAKERKELVDRILALTNPIAHTLVNPRVSTQGSSMVRPRSLYPGYFPGRSAPAVTQVDLDAALPKHNEDS